MPAEPNTAAEFNVVSDTRYGPMLCNKHDAYVGQSLLKYGEFSEGEAELFRLLLPAGCYVVEAGSNIGALTIPIAHHVSPTGRVFAFEPQRLAFQLLNANVALNSLTNVVTKQVAVGAVRGSIAVPYLDPTVPNNVGGLSLRADYGDAVPKEQVGVVPLDDFAGLLPRCDLLKADVEGAEFDVLLGARDLIAATKPVLYLEADRGDQLNAVINLLERYGYPVSRCFVHRPPLYSPNNYLGDRENIFGEIVSINLLCFHSSLDEVPDLTGIHHLTTLIQAVQRQPEAAA